MFVIGEFIKYKMSIANTTRQLNRMQDELKFKRAEVLDLVFDYCKDNTIVPSDYNVSKWQKIVKSYQPDMFHSFHNQHRSETADAFLNEVLNTSVSVDKEEIEQLCGALFKRSIASHLVSLEGIERAILENDRLYGLRLEYLKAAYMYKLENDEMGEEELINFNITHAREKNKYSEDHKRVLDKLSNTLLKINALSMSNLHALGYTQDLQRTLQSKKKDHTRIFEIVEYKGKNHIDVEDNT
jgi:hypothetical protein